MANQHLFSLDIRSSSSERVHFILDGDGKGRWSGQRGRGENSITYTLQEFPNTFICDGCITRSEYFQLYSIVARKRIEKNRCQG